MGGHESVNHQIYSLEEWQNPPGYMLVGRYGKPRISKSKLQELKRAVKKTDLNLNFDLDSLALESDPSVSPLLFFSLPSTEISKRDLYNQVRGLTGKFFPGVVQTVFLSEQTR